MIEARLKGGPLHGKVYAMQYGEPLKAAMISPRRIHRLNEGEGYGLEFPYFELTYERSSRTDWGEWEYEWVDMVPNADTQLRKKIRLEELTDLTAQIIELQASKRALMRENEALTEELDAMREDWR